MKVWFVGAGPGAADLITLRGAACLKKAELVLYAGSLVPEAVLEHVPEGIPLINTAPLNLDEQLAAMTDAMEKGVANIARVHSGDPAIYGAVSEQARRLEEAGIEWEVIPGVSSFTACAAALGTDLTKPQIAQSIIITRSQGRASPLPPREQLSRFAAHGTTMCIFLSGPMLGDIVGTLLDHYPAETPIALVHRASQPEQRILKSRLGEIMSQTEPKEWQLTTMLLVGPVLNPKLVRASCLYDPDYPHRFRKVVPERPAAQ